MQNDILANTNKRERMRMASDGENIEAHVTKNEPEVLAELIKNGYAQNHYDEWKTHEHGTVRYALACQGLFPETFINDKNPTVRISIHAPVRGYDRAHCPACGLIGSHAVPNTPRCYQTR